MAFPQATLTSQGLQYDVADYALDFAYQESTCNKFRTAQAELLISGEALIIYPAAAELLSATPK